MVAPEPLVTCSKTLQNVFLSVQHPQHRVWGPTCDHSGPKNTAKHCVFLVMAALKPLIVCSETLQNTFF